MPTENKKKKTKKEEKKVSMLIKSEPDELKSLEHYVDDRIELIRQIFGSLKTKTIESILPEFLQGKSNEEIQEICLEEVLGISKKRLLSIINATKCPTDTESSDSGSDVEKIEEHISLEEISSDSNDELSKPKKKKKREEKKVEVASKSGPELPKTSEQNGEKQYSVLELLELQARARAIRSQLALEPVTKIELDDSDGESVNKDDEKEQSTDTVPKSSQNNSSQKNRGINLLDQSEELSKGPSTRPIRLKRNFRQRQMEGYESDETPSVNDKEKESVIVPQIAEKSAEKEVEKEKSPVKSDVPVAPHDDDVVPIIAEPEILCISSSDSENEDKKDANKARKRYINMPVVEKEVRPPTEDELFLLKIKEKTEAKKRAESSNATKTDKTTDRPGQTNNDGDSEETQNEQNLNKEIQSKTAEPQQPEEKEEEMEDGEIIEEDEIVEIPESPEPPAEPAKEKCDDSDETKKADSDNADACRELSVQKTDKSGSGANSSGSESDSDKSSSTGNSDSESENSEPKARSQTSKKSNVDDDDEDIIDLGKDEDLDFEQLEMATTPDEPEKEQRMRHTRSKTKSRKSPERQSPTEPKDESWDKRWLRGNKVSKVLATAKLASKVRSKIKEKKTKNVAQKTEDVEPPKEIPTPIPANVEVGSVEHYKELTKQK